MPLADLATGDTLVFSTISGGTWGDAPTATAGDGLDCRVEIQNVRENRRGGGADYVRQAIAYFVDNPNVSTGQYARWTYTGGAEGSASRTAMSPVPVFRVVGWFQEAMPSQTPLYYEVHLVEDTAEDAGEFVT